MNYVQKNQMGVVPFDPDLLPLAAVIVSAHASGNRVEPEALSEIIRSVYAALSAVSAAVPEAATPEPAVPVKRSVFPDHIVCLEDGRKMKVLKGHLRFAHGLTPQEYRRLWSLSDS